MSAGRLPTRLESVLGRLVAAGITEQGRLATLLGVEAAVLSRPLHELVRAGALARGAAGLELSARGRIWLDLPAPEAPAARHLRLIPALREAGAGEWAEEGGDELEGLAPTSNPLPSPGERALDTGAAASPEATPAERTGVRGALDRALAALGLRDPADDDEAWDAPDWETGRPGESNGLAPGSGHAEHVAHGAPEPARTPVTAAHVQGQRNSPATGAGSEDRVARGRARVAAAAAFGVLSSLGGHVPRVSVRSRTFSRRGLLAAAGAATVVLAGVRLGLPSSGSGAVAAGADARPTPHLIVLATPEPEPPLSVTTDEWLEVRHTEGLGVVLRTAPASTDRLLLLPEGARIKRTGAPVQQAGRAWLPVVSPTGKSGWVAGDFVVPAP